MCAVSASPHAMAVYGSGREAAGVMSSHTPRTGHGVRVVALSFSPCRGGRTSQERSWEAEISRLRGVVLLRQPGTPQAEAEAWLQRALDVARRQEAKSLELRAAMSLAACGSSRASTPKPTRCWHRSMAGSPRALTRPTSRRRKALLEALGG